MVHRWFVGSGVPGRCRGFKKTPISTAKNPKTTLWAAQEADSAASSTWLLTVEAWRSQWK
jgi:hypothetical protein